MKSLGRDQDQGQGVMLNRCYRWKQLHDSFIRGEILFLLIVGCFNSRPKAEETSRKDDVRFYFVCVFLWNLDQTVECMYVAENGH